MKMLRYGFSLLILALASCEKNIEVKVPKHESKLALYSVNKPGETFTATVSKSVGILDYNPNVDLHVTNAFVRLLDNGLVVDTLVYDPTEQQYKSDVLAEMGHAYTLQATADETGTAYAMAGFTNNVGLSNIERIQNAKVNQNGEPMDELVVTFSDPPASSDYYRVSFTFGGMTFYGCVQSNDPSIENPSDDLAGESCLSASGIYLSDNLFNGQQKSLHMFVDHYMLEPYIDEFGNIIHATLRFEYLSEDYFRYLKTYDFAQWNDGNPFAEPTNVYSNVNNGFGVFAIVGVSDYEIQ